MKRLQAILNQYAFPDETIKKIHAKKTEKGAILELSTWHSFHQVFPDDETVFLKLFDARRLNANDTCICGCKIGRSYIRLNKRKFKCGNCKRIVSPMVGTPLQGMHFDLSKFLSLGYWTYQSRQGYTTAKIVRYFNWKYDTALDLRHRMSEWMGLAMDKMLFNSDQPIEVDEVFPPIPSGLPPGVPRTRGLGSEGVKPTMVMAQRGGIVKAKVVEEVKKHVIQPMFHTSIAAGSQIYTDGKAVYNFLSKDEFKYEHSACNHSIKQWVDGDVHVNLAESYNGRLQTQVRHMHNGVAEENLQGYADDVAWAFSHRFRDVYEAIDSLFDCLPPLNHEIKISEE